MGLNRIQAISDTSIVIEEEGGQSFRFAQDVTVTTP